MTLGLDVAGWAERHLGSPLLSWQVHALEGLLELEDEDRVVLANRTGYVSVARQQGKSFLGIALAGWWLTDYARERGKPQVVCIVADELSLASRHFEVLAPILETHFGFKPKWSYGRLTAKDELGNELLIKAATPSAPHGLSIDLVWADEIWNITDEVLAQGFKPTQKARNKRTSGGSPLFFMTSTAGTEASVAQLRYREQGLKAIDAGKPDKFYMAEWSMPEDADPMDVSLWGWPNPALGELLELDDLLADSKHPDRLSFLRGSLNLFVSDDQAMLQPGEWAACQSEDPFPTGTKSWVAVDSSMDATRYVAVQAATDDLGVVHVRTVFNVPTMRECMVELDRLAGEDPLAMFAITPTLEAHVPKALEKRKQTVGYGEVLKWTSLFKSLVLEKMIAHDGEEALAAHVNRAVAVRQQHSLAVSSKRSPGPIELMRCALFAAALAAKPMGKGRPTIGVGTR